MRPWHTGTHRSEFNLKSPLARHLNLRQKEKQMRRVATVTVGGIRIPVRRQSYGEGSAFLEGWSLPGEIMVTDHGPPDRQEDTFAHECLHQILDYSGLAYRLQNLTGLEGEDWDKLEEELIRTLVPHILGAWRSVGWLKRLPWCK